jgi:hypothetical protein
VIEAAELGEARIERTLAGVAKRRVAEIVAERRALGEVLVEANRAGERACNLGHFQSVGQPGAEMIPFVKHEDLGLVGETAERGGVDNAVAIASKRAACGAGGLRIEPAAAVTYIRCKRRGHFDRHAWALSD